MSGKDAMESTLSADKGSVATSADFAEDHYHAPPPPAVVTTKIKMANPGPTGLVAFGITTILLNFKVCWPI